MNMGKISSLVLVLISSLSWAQEERVQSPLECAWPQYAENATELERIVADMDSSMYCVNVTAGKWLSELDELDKFLEGKDILNSFIGRLKIIQNSFQYLKAACAPEKNNEHPFCESFNTNVLNSEWLKVVYFHAVIMLNDVDLLKSWVSNMPIYDVNKMIHLKRLKSAKFRFTLAEKVAGAPYMKLEILKALGDLGLLNPQSDESFPITYAISNRQFEKLKYLIEYGYDPNAVDTKPLERYMDPKQLVGADPQDGYTPLIRAIGYEDQQIFDYLMSLDSVDINKAGAVDGNSPFMVALHHVAFGGSYYAYGRLLNDPRTNINHQNKGGKTALTWLGSVGAPEKEVKAITNNPRFNPTSHCSEEYPCLASVISSCDLSKVKAYQPLFSAIKRDSKAYNVGSEVGLTVFEYIDRLLLREKDLKKAKELKKIKKYLLSQLTK